jgi:hypothetical protein
MDMIKCPNCYTLNSPGSVHCERCQKRLTISSRVCPNCGKQNPLEAWNCSACGATLSIDTIADVVSESVGSAQNESNDRISAPKSGFSISILTPNALEKEEFKGSQEDDVLVSHRRKPLEAIGIVSQRVIRAIRLDATLYDELKSDPQASSDAFKFIIFLGLLSGIGGEIQKGTQAFATYFFSFFVDYYFLVIITWLIGVKMTRRNDSFTQVQTALAYAYTPHLLLSFPTPWFYLFIWGFVTLSFAIRKTLGISIILVFIILIGQSLLADYLRPLIVWWLLRLLIILLEQFLIDK